MIDFFCKGSDLYFLSLSPFYDTTDAFCNGICVMPSPSERLFGDDMYKLSHQTIQSPVKGMKTILKSISTMIVMAQEEGPGLRQ